MRAKKTTTKQFSFITAFLIAGALSAFAWDSLDFALPSGSKESLWQDALARKVGGVTEVKIKAGRMDVTTSNEVYEVKWIHNWKEGMGQVLAYTGETRKKPVLALISYSQGASNLTTKTKAILNQAETECVRHDIRLLVLFPTLPEAPHTSTNRVQRN
jgi:hypothetical protein